MTLLEGWLTSKRRGVRDAKLWVSWPVRIDPPTLDRLYRAVNGKVRAPVEVLRNTMPVEVVRPTHYNSVANQVRFGMYDDHVRSIELRGYVTLYIGPRTVYAFAWSKDTRALAALWEVQNVLKSARHLPANVLYRTWGAAAVFAIVMIVGMLSGSFTSEAYPAVLVAAGICVIYVAAALVAGVFFRVRFRLDGEVERRQRIRNGLWTGATVLAGFLGAILSNVFS